MADLNRIRARLADPFYDVPGLTDQQRACARLFGKGILTTDIAHSLGISRSAVYSHLNAVAERVAMMQGEGPVKVANLPAIAWQTLEEEAAG